ncbi:MAG TPA: YdcF family protein, partial [Steroidobacteraceae bacterium]|nr:YdcF family protein [Steroidobacteraceae bacterium]
SMLLAFLGVLLLRRAPRLGRALVVIGIASIWLLSTPIVADQLTVWVEHYAPLDLRQPTGAQAIVILGGGGQRRYAPEYAGPEAEPYLLERVAYGAFVAQRTGLPILVTGFGIEALAMRESLKRHFSIEARWVDDQSYDTFENARNSVRILKSAGIQRTILVTRSTHLWRSVHEFEAAGIEVVPAPVGSFAVRDLNIFRFLPDTEALTRSHAAIYEALGDLVRRALATTHLRRH